MRTKSILLGAAVLAAGVASSMAQNVYSVNVVGYINLPIVGFSDARTNNGSGVYTLIANPLDASANGGNAISNVLQNPADSTTVLIWDPVHNRYNGDSFVFGSWANGGTNLLPPGSAAFVLSPSSWTNTFTGTVMQGSLSNVFGNRSINTFVGSQVPVNGTADSLGLTPGLPDGSAVEPWSVSKQTFNGQGYSWVFGQWNDPQGNQNPPPISIGEGLLINTPAGQSGYWATNFTVQ